MDNSEFKDIELNGVVLAVDKQMLLLDKWNNSLSTKPPSLKELVIIAFGGEFDGRSNQGKLVKKFFAERKIKPKAAQEYIRKNPVDGLTNEQKEFIYNHITGETSLSSLEIARTLFNNSNIMPLDSEARLVLNYIDNLQNGNSLKREWKPPKTIEQLIIRINRYVLNGINKDSISSKQKKDLEAIMRFLNTHRLGLMLNNYDDEMSRELFESSFVRFTYDKADLTEEEVDQYISVCGDIVQDIRMQAELDNLTKIREHITNDSDGKLSMSIVESLGKLYNEIDNNRKRQQRALETLNGKRNERMKNKVKENQSVVALVEAWRNKEQRDRMIRLADLKKKELEAEVDKLDSMESLKASVYGITKEEILGDVK